MGLGERSDPRLLRSVMNHLAEALRLVAHLSRPFMTQAPAKIFEQLGLKDQMDLDFTQLIWGLPSRRKRGIKILIFQRMQRQK